MKRSKFSDGQIAVAPPLVIWTASRLNSCENLLRICIHTSWLIMNLFECVHKIREDQRPVGMFDC